MSVRTLLLTVLAVILGLSLAVILLSLSYVRGQLMGLLPDVASAGAMSFGDILLGTAIMLFVAAVVLLGSTYLAIDRLILLPLRALTRAMNVYTASGTRTALPHLRMAPKELQSLDASFLGLIERVETVHKRDTEASRVKSDFISTAAHQLRTPLTGIRWALEALQKEPLQETQQALVKSAVDKSHDLVAIVSTLLDISSIESGKYHYRFAPTDMEALAAEVAADFAPLASSRGVSVMYAGEGGIPRTARADRERIKWVLNNLVENAIRYTPHGGSIRITTESGRDRVFVKVKDTGIGIAPQDRGNIFERFYRGQNAISKENGGNGLGLYIARTVATDHGGDLSFMQNEEGPGTTFILSLPSA